MDTLVAFIGLALVALAIVSGWIWVTLSLARYRAIRDGQKNLSMFGGKVRLVLWEQNEGLIFLKYKRVSDVVSGGGGTRFISPLRGEELRARVPLTLRLLTWEDKAIPTHESIQVAMKVAVWWRVEDLKKYVFNIDSGIHVGQSHENVGVLEAAEAWLKTLTESTLRMLVSEASVASLISSRAVDYLQSPSRLTSQSGPAAIGSGTPEALTADLARGLSAKAADYGLEVQRVEIQSIRLAPEIQEAIDRVWKASLLPAQSEGEARARQIELQAAAAVLGVDTVALNEVMKNFQGSSFFGMPAFLESLFSRVGDKTALAKSLGPSGAPPALPEKAN
jgi:regulator of protease activity HflC (stomatin/prohibitin superfamily)